MDIDLLIWAAALVTVLGTGVVYGTDVFCAVVLRPALARVDDQTLVTTIGYVHRYADRRMPVPGVLGILAAAASVVTATVAGHTVQSVAAGTALSALLIWLLIYTRPSAPINRRLTAAAEMGRLLPNGRALQATWDSVINVRAALQGLAVAAACVVLLT
jgi:formate-dependent phosphoribosylglycinamide formyltransferase (GAR transformylase)